MNNIQGYGRVQANGGNGNGGGGGGRIAMRFLDNSTFTGKFLTYGGVNLLSNNTECIGSAGTIYFYHKCK